MRKKIEREREIEIKKNDDDNMLNEMKRKQNIFLKIWLKMTW